MQPVRRTDPAVVAAPVGRYTHLNTAEDGHDLVFVSGQVGNLPDGSTAGDGADAQTRQVLANIGLLVAELGVTPQHIVKFTTFVVGTETLPGFRTGRDAVFDQWYPDGRTPGHTLAVVTALAGPGLLVETEAVVAVPRRSAG